MTPERLRQIEELFHAARERTPAERGPFLEDACAGDPALRREVESLLAQQPAGLIDTPVAALAASLMPSLGPRLEPGVTLGPYRIERLIGMGGMGEVYRARDTKLGRDVAIKVLPESLKGDPERLARFSREAQVLATLNHPHIAAIYGLEDRSDVQALVMEWIDGPTLADRIAGAPIPLAEALPIAHQIVQALEAAHEQGIIHRDLKPANIKVRPDGTVKVLDFGLAKAMEPRSAVNTNAVNSPTVTEQTVPGVILGTAAYMSPEQAAGKAVDKRSDLWAFGAVLMETLTGRQVFTGDTVSHVLAAVLAKDPDWTMLPHATPASIRTLLRRCLQKDPKRRIADAADVRLEIDDALAASPDDVNVSNRARSKNRWPPLAVGVIVAALVIAGLLARRGADRGQPTAVYASIDAPADYVLGEDDVLVPLPTRTPIVFTTDGRSLIIQAARAGKPQLFLRSLDRPDARPIAGTDDARVPFVSPDGKWVGFWAANEVRKVPIEGGTPTTICPLLGTTLGPTGAAWGVRDVILFGDPVTGRVMRVSAGGGTPTPMAGTAQPRHLHVAPFFLPDGTRFLFSDVSVLDASDTRLMVQSLDGGDARVVVPAATDGRVLPSGRLTFMRLGTLMTVGFDLARAEINGDPVAALAGVMQSGLRYRAGANNTGAGMFAVSSLGALAVVRGPVTGGEENHLVWVTRSGQSSSAEPASGAPTGARNYTRISPDQSRAIVTLITPTRFEHWFADWTRDVWTACGDCNGDDISPLLWSHDGRRLLFTRNDTLLAHALDGSTPDQAMVREADRRPQAAAWLADGRIVYTSSPTSTFSAVDVEIKLLDVGARAGRTVVPLGMGREPDVSPDGRWLAYTSTQTDQRSVVVQALPGPGSLTPVSAGGGADPVWSADGRTLYYLKPGPDRGGTAAFAVDIATSGGVLTAGTPRELFRNPDPQIASPRSYDVADGPRFLLKDRSKRASVTRMELVLNWTSTLPKGR